MQTAGLHQKNLGSRGAAETGPDIRIEKFQDAPNRQTIISLPQANDPSLFRRALAFARVRLLLRGYRRSVLLRI